MASPFDSSTATLLWCAFALFLGGVIKGTFGIGTPLLTVPLMSLVLPPQLTVVLMAAPVLLANGWQAFKAGNSIAVLRRFWPMCVAMLMFTWVGTSVLASIDARPLIVIIGSLIVTFALIQYARPRYRCPPRLERSAGIAAGMVAGVVGGVSSMFGPPLILFLLSLHLRKNDFVQSISILFLWAVIPLGRFAVFVRHAGCANDASVARGGLADDLRHCRRAAPAQVCRRCAVPRLDPFIVAISGSVMLVRATLV
ncbi:MAG: sulfite exporter TauE/SafE family protein [Gammaproteobacteria bacterium]|nr:sulfite exporter TauE/SafE family protein [Gammaproteobacteria bacterium]